MVTTALTSVAILFALILCFDTSVFQTKTDQQTDEYQSWYNRPHDDRNRLEIRAVISRSS